MFLTELLQCRSGSWWCVLLLDLPEFFFVLIRPYILHLAQFVQLAQGQACLAQIAQSGLAVVLAYVLIGLGLTPVDFVEYHDMLFIKDRARQQVPLQQQVLRLQQVQWR